MKKDDITLHWHNGDVLQSNMTFLIICSFSCVIYVQSSLNVVVNLSFCLLSYFGAAAVLLRICLYVTCQML